MKLSLSQVIRIRFLIAILLIVSPSAFAKKKETVGDLLKMANRGGSEGQRKKTNTQLPKTEANLFSQNKNVPRINLSQIKPPRTNSFLEEGNSDRAQLERVTDQQIEELFKLVKKYQGSSQRGELWLRLAELYVEKAGVIDFRRQSEYDERLKAYQDGKSKQRPRLDLRDAQEYNRKAIQLYEWFIRDFPRDPKTDQALFFLGYNYFEIGDIKKGSSYYSRLVKESPNSPFITESHFALAEFKFEAEKWKEAAEHYAEVIKKKRHRLYTFSLYKYSWSLFRSGQTAKAASILESLVLLSKETAVAGEGKKISKVRLENEALRDLVLFYSESGQPEKAVQYFERLAGNESLNYLEKLAYYYADQGQRDGARQIFNYLISKNPKSPKSFDYKYQIVRILATAPKTRDFREELYSWIRDFGVESQWYNANKDNQELVTNSLKLREVTLRTWILQQHQAAQISRARYTQSLAMEGYRIYLREFSQAALLADMHFYYGELLYEMEKYDEAGEHYRWVVQNAPQSKYGSRAAENIILALERDLPKEQEINNKNTDGAPIPLSPRVTRFFESAKWFMEKYPDDKKFVDVKFKTGRIYYQHNQFDQAIPIFKSIVEEHPGTKYAEYSANLLLDIFNIKKDYAGLEKTGQELLAHKGFSNSAAGGEIRSILEKANFKKAQDLEGQKNFQASAEQFELFAKQNPRSELALAASFNAAINFERAGGISDSIRNHVIVLGSSQKNSQELKHKSRPILAKLYQELGFFPESAETFQAAAADRSKDKNVENFHFNSGVMYDLAGSHQKAIEQYEMFFRKSRASERVDALFLIAQIHRQNDREKVALQYFREFLEISPKRNTNRPEAAYWAYEISKRRNRKSDMQDFKKTVLDLYNQQRGANETSHYAAQVHFDEAKEIYSHLTAIRIPANPQKQEKVFNEKIALVAQLNAKLLQVIKFNSSDEIVNSLALLGDANSHMGEAILDAPMRKDLNKLESENYRVEIQKVAAPFLGKAKESWAAAIDRASELEAYTDSAERARENLQKVEGRKSDFFGELTQPMQQLVWIEK